MRGEKITIRGVTYANAKAAAAALCVATNTISSAKRRRRLDMVGTGSKNGTAPKQPMVQKIETTAPKTLLDLMAQMAANENAAARALWYGGLH